MLLRLLIPAMVRAWKGLLQDNCTPIHALSTVPSGTEGSAYFFAPAFLPDHFLQKLLTGSCRFQSRTILLTPVCSKFISPAFFYYRIKDYFFSFSVP